MTMGSGIRLITETLMTYCTLLGVSPGFDGNVQATGAEDRLPGVQTRLQDAVWDARLIAIVRDVEIGGTQPDFMAKAYYDAKARVTRRLKGDGPDVLSPVSIMTRTFPEDVAETPPNNHEPYLFFIRGGDAGHPRRDAIKIIPATDENIRATEAALKVEERLPAHDVSLQDAARQAWLIAEVRNVQMALPDPVQDGMTRYPRARMQITRRLKGDGPDRLSPDDFSPVQIVIRTSPKNQAEATPGRDAEYLAFLRRDAGPSRPQWSLIKLLRATDENAHAVEEALKAPAP
jgi:hypothetical protein